MQRLFLVETGLPFTRWRARARLNIAITRLRGGDSLTVAAHLAGYATRGGLLEALHRETGIPETLLSRAPLSALVPRTEQSPVVSIESMRLSRR